MRTGCSDLHRLPYSLLFVLSLVLSQRRKCLGPSPTIKIDKVVPMPFDTEVVENNVDVVIIRAEIKYEADAEAWLYISTADNLGSGRALAFRHDLWFLKVQAYCFHFPWDNFFQRLVKPFLKNKDIQLLDTFYGSYMHIHVNLSHPLTIYAPCLSGESEYGP